MSESDESYYSTDDEDEEEEDEIPNEDLIAARLQSITLENRRPPPPVPQLSKPAGKDQPQLSGELERPSLSKMETSESLGDPFGDKNTVDKNNSVYY